MWHYILIFGVIIAQLNDLRSEVDSTFAPVKISLLTCKSGDELYSTFAHTALRIQNTETGQDVVFNYGTFDTDTPNFYLKFLRGKLDYKLSVTTMERFLRSYNYQQRSVMEQDLDLSLVQKQRLYEAIIINYLPENKFYKYDFFFDNCTTRTIDIITLATGKIDYERRLDDITFRQMLKQYLHGMPWSSFGIDLIIGAIADKKTSREDQHFLPIYLYKDINDANVSSSGKKLVEKDYKVLNYDSEDLKRQTPRTNWPLYLTLLLLVMEVVVMVFGSGRILTYYDNIWFALLGSGGIVMAFMWFGTDHLATKSNYNLLWANLLFWPYLFVKERTVKRVVGYILITCSLLAVCNTFSQFLPQYFHEAFGVMALISMVKVGRKMALEHYF